MIAEKNLGSLTLLQYSHLLLTFEFFLIDYYIQDKIALSFKFCLNHGAAKNHSGYQISLVLHNFHFQSHILWLTFAFSER